MYKRITAGQELRITGENIYPGIDTVIYFNSVATENEAEVVPDSFNELGSEVRIRIPQSLPNKLNYIIIKNEVGTYQGTQQYEFIGHPQISEVTPSERYWGEQFVINGAYLQGTTGVLVGENGLSAFAIENGERILAQVPIDIPEGVSSVSVKTNVGEVKGSLQVLEPNIYAELTYEGYPNGALYGDSVRLEKGSSLHKVNRIVASGLGGPINIDSFTSFGSTGISFEVPEGTMDGHTLRLQRQSGVFVGGVFQPNVLEEYEVEQNLKINSPFIYSVGATAGKYEDQIRVDGVNLGSCEMFFSGYGGSQVEAPVVSAAGTFINISIPKNIIEEKITAIGTGDVQGAHSSVDTLYPLPSISSISATEWEIGGTIQIEAINATQIAKTISISGTDTQKEEHGLFFVSNFAGATSHQAELFGEMVLDYSSLLDSAETGVTKISAEINADMIGYGNPFLIASQEISSMGIGTYQALLQGSITLSRLNDLTGQQVSVVGKQPTFLSVDSPRTTKTDIVQIQGQYLLTATGLGLQGVGENHVLAKEDWEIFGDGQFDPRVQVAEENSNIYEATHTIAINLSKIPFSGTSGEFYFLT